MTVQSDDSSDQASGSGEIEARQSEDGSFEFIVDEEPSAAPGHRTDDADAVEQTSVPAAERSGMGPRRWMAMAAGLVVILIGVFVIATTGGDESGSEGEAERVDDESEGADGFRPYKGNVAAEDRPSGERERADRADKPDKREEKEKQAEADEKSEAEDSARSQNRRGDPGKARQKDWDLEEEQRRADEEMAKDKARRADVESDQQADEEQSDSADDESDDKEVDNKKIHDARQRIERRPEMPKLRDNIRPQKIEQLREKREEGDLGREDRERLEGGEESRR